MAKGLHLQIILSFIAMVFQISVAMGQELKNMKPSYVQLLDFSDEAKAGWARRDALLEQLVNGTKEWDNLSKEEEQLLEKYEEFYENIWDIVGGGDSWYNAGGPKKVAASSHLKSQGSNTYDPQNAHDLSYKNAWVEGVPGYGIGEYLTYTFSAASPRITDIIVVNGYVKSESAYRNNSRVKKLKVYLNDKPYAILNLEDKIAKQGFKVEPIGYDDRDNLDLLSNQSDFTLKFEILEVYKGAKYADVAITEIYFDGLDVLCFAKGTKVQLANRLQKNIENLKVGDLVMSMDPKTSQLYTTRVEKLEKVIHHNLVTYKFESGLSITATQDHPFKIKNKGWASLKPQQSRQYKGFEQVNIINIGDQFQTATGVEKLVDIEWLKGKQDTYTISKLSAGNSFIANGLVVAVEELNNNAKAIDN